ncbi:hypothetical protein [Phaffia rhodozyma]|uniref:INO80 complex subunit F domain-containing protein n=1 Tax=Phaffia rhodozyma TaxID=264483 RepID=A0A0F7SMP4_PHARH|nr:hypothetical protein [Phaffia rhodozyma]
MPSTESAGVPTSTVEETGVLAPAPTPTGAAVGAVAATTTTTTGAEYTHHRGPLPKTKSRAYGAQLSRDGDIQKYKAKYKDLKLKVKQIEKDNDKLLLKILKAKKDIQRARLERAIIYERLSVPIEPPAPTDPSLPSYESHFLPPAPSPSLLAHASQSDAPPHPLSSLLSPTAQAKAKDLTDGSIGGELGQESVSKLEEPASAVSASTVDANLKHDNDDTATTTDADASAPVAVPEPLSGNQPNGPLSPSPPSPSVSTSTPLNSSASLQPPVPALSSGSHVETGLVPEPGREEEEEEEEEGPENGKMHVDQE